MQRDRVPKLNFIKHFTQRAPLIQYMCFDFNDLQEFRATKSNEKGNSQPKIT